jgi:serine/threonine protein kinase
MHELPQAAMLRPPSGQGAGAQCNRLHTLTRAHELATGNGHLEHQQHRRQRSPSSHEQPRRGMWGEDSPQCLHAGARGDSLSPLPLRGRMGARERSRSPGASRRCAPPPLSHVGGRWGEGVRPRSGGAGTGGSAVLDLLSRLLTWDPSQRLGAEAARHHPWFQVDGMSHGG